MSDLPPDITPIPEIREYEPDHPYWVLRAADEALGTDWSSPGVVAEQFVLRLADVDRFLEDLGTIVSPTVTYEQLVQCAQSIAGVELSIVHPHRVEPPFAYVKFARGISAHGTLVEGTWYEYHVVTLEVVDDRWQIVGFI
jgi:hypothetical protein